MILYFNNYLNNAQNLDSKILQSGPRLTFDKSFETTHYNFVGLSNQHCRQNINSDK